MGVEFLGYASWWTIYAGCLIPDRQALQVDPVSHVTHMSQRKQLQKQYRSGFVRELSVVFALCCFPRLLLVAFPPFFLLGFAFVVARVTSTAGTRKITHFFPTFFFLGFAYKYARCFAHHDKTHPIPSHHITSHHLTPHHTASNQITSHHITHIKSRHTTFITADQNHVISHRYKKKQKKNKKKGGKNGREKARSRAQVTVMHVF